MRFSSFYSVKLSSENKPIFKTHFHTVKWTKFHSFGIIWEKSQFTDMLHHIFASGLVSYNFCMIPLACAWNFGCTNSEFSKSHCKSAFPELLHPKSQVQTSGIIQKLYETKPEANMWCSISVKWLFSQIIPKMWDLIHFTVWKWALKTGEITHFWLYLRKKSVNRFESPCICVSLGLIQLLYDTTSLNLKLWV